MESELARWLLKQEIFDDDLLPLTHVTSCITARKIIRDGFVKPIRCDVIGDTVAFFFYGRPAFRVNNDEVVKLESASPFCFVFSPKLIEKAKDIYAFDTGAFAKRLYNNVLHEGFELESFSLGDDSSMPNRLIARVFADKSSYIRGDCSKIVDVSYISAPHEFEARAYLKLLSSPGRNEPDDRVSAIEVQIASQVDVKQNLLAISLPHTLCGLDDKPDWLAELEQERIHLLPYMFVPGRPPEHYHSILEQSVHSYYELNGWL
jgi:hypothetical protein